MNLASEHLAKIEFHKFVIVQNTKEASGFNLDGPNQVLTGSLNATYMTFTLLKQHRPL